MAGFGASEGCTFCNRDELEIVLAETSRLYVLADNAPLTEGHLLIIPKAHVPCLGAAPPELDDELSTLKGRVATFLEAAYRSACFFEHGVYRQTVYHAHLHAFPLGASVASDQIMAEVERAGGRPVQQLTDVREWYATRGRYFYIEQTPPNGAGSSGAIFPPDDAVYFRVLGQLVSAADRHQPFQPQSARRLAGGPRMQALAQAWTRFHDTP